MRANVALLKCGEGATRGRVLPILVRYSVEKNYQVEPTQPEFLKKNRVEPAQHDFELLELNPLSTNLIIETSG